MKEEKDLNKQELQDKIISIICDYLMYENKLYKDNIKNLMKEKRRI